MNLNANAIKMRLGGKWIDEGHAHAPIFKSLGASGILNDTGMDFEDAHANGHVCGCVHACGISKCHGNDRQMTCLSI